MTPRHTPTPRRVAPVVKRHLCHYLGAALFIVLVAWATAPGRAAISQWGF